MRNKKSQPNRLRIFGAPRRTRTLHNGSEDHCDIHFTIGACFVEFVMSVFVAGLQRQRFLNYVVAIDLKLNLHLTSLNRYLARSKQPNGYWLFIQIVMPQFIVGIK